MVHQLQLCSTIPQDKYLQTISTLQAFTGVLHPQEVSTYTLLTRPHNLFKPKFEPGKVNQIEQYYMRCTTIWDDDAAKDLNLREPIVKDKQGLFVNQLFAGKVTKHWTLQICDIPNAGKNPILAQNFYESTLIHHHTVKPIHDPTQAAPEETLDIKTENEPKQELGDSSNPMEIDDASDLVEFELADGEVKKPVIKDENSNGNEPMQQDEKDPQEHKQQETSEKQDIKEPEKAKTEPAVPETKDSFLQFLEDLGYDLVNQYWLKGIRFFHNDVVIEIYKLFIRDDSVPLENGKLKLKLLDESNTFQVKAFINYPRGTNVDVVSHGTKQLIKMRETLHNLFELEVPDRMYMDSRVTRTT